MGISVGAARDAAPQWVLENAALEEGFRRAFFHGSTGWLPDDALLPAASDVDVMVVFDDAELRTKPGKFRYGGVLLEVSYMPSDRLGSPEIVLGRPELAGSFRGRSVFSDPSGWLTALQDTVARDYAKRRWVIERCGGIRYNVLGYLRLLEGSGPFHEGVTNWLFATGSTALMPLVAGLRNPTVRKRYAAAGATGRLWAPGLLREPPQVARMRQDGTGAGRAPPGHAHGGFRRRREGDRDTLLPRPGHQRRREARRDRR